MAVTMINLFEYQDYRAYLRDYYEERKKAGKGFSYRSFSSQAGINAPSFLYYVITGKRNMTKKTILKISQAIGLSHEEGDYFENLVFFNQATTITEKTIYYNKLAERRRHLDIEETGKEQFEYFEKWYHCVIRELVSSAPIRENFHTLARMLVPSIRPSDALRSVQLLEQLGFIERDTEGYFHQTNALVGVKASGPLGLVIERFQQDMLGIAMKSYERFPRAQRLCASTTLALSEEAFNLIRLRTRDFRREILEIAKLDTSPERVYQYTFNLFPLTERMHDGYEKE